MGAIKATSVGLQTALRELRRYVLAETITGRTSALTRAKLDDRLMRLCYLVTDEADKLGMEQLRKIMARATRTANGG